MSSDLLSHLTRQKSRGASGSLAADGERRWDIWLLFFVGALVTYGLVMLYSASAVMASQRMAAHNVLLWSQTQKIVLGVGLLIFALQFDYRWYKRLVYPILLGTVLLLILVTIPGIGVVQNGARRWFSLGGLSFQPAEVAKLTAVIFMAYSVSKKAKRMGSFTIGFLPHLVIIGLMVGLLMLQPDFGSSVILISMMMLLLFVSGARFSYLLVMTLCGAGLAYVAISNSEYRMKRILAFLDPWSHRQDIGYQISESLIAIGASGLSGRGLGNGAGKLGYVPELWNDFIGTIIAEELGFVGVVVLLSLFIGMLWRGYRVAFNAVDAFGMYLAFGITSLFALQGMANLFVVTGMLPTKGLTLPFVSFGGTSMIISLFAIGIVLNISRNDEDTWEEERDHRAARREERRWERKRRNILKRRDDLRS
ncbi:putative lipid II flippase FtsW [Bradymonadaceae bacterium TMQ3]|nr:putative lipid II flippase FtsW [Bradymonadaceae bacterium TMQ3]TXC77913.1 putative lipid II flippase FtsW [Bradymonadales bacterium TMQ1]